MHSHARISILSLHFPPEVTGNAPYVGALASELGREGFEVSAKVGHPHYPEWTIHEGYGQWRRSETYGEVKVTRLRHYVPRPPRGVRRLLSELSFGVRLALTPWGSPDVVIAVSPALFATAVATLRARLMPHRPKIVIWVQDLYSVGMSEIGGGSGAAARITSWAEARVLRAADHVVVIHERFAAIVQNELGVAPDTVDVIRNWTHVSGRGDVNRRICREALGWPTDRVLAVHTGNMGAKQGLENVVEAARLAQASGAQVQFVLVGDGGQRSKLKVLGEGISSLSFVDPLDDEDYARALGAADVLLVNEKEGVASMSVPSKLTSYFNAGRPVVAATDPEGITASEITLADAGVVVPPGSPTALLEAIIQLANDRAEGDRLARNGREYRRSRLDQGSAVARFSAVIQSLLGTRKHNR